MILVVVVFLRFYEENDMEIDLFMYYFVGMSILLGYEVISCLVVEGGFVEVVCWVYF